MSSEIQLHLKTHPDLIIQVRRGDLLVEAVDAIVNPTNSIVFSYGLCTDLHRAGGKGLRLATKAIGSLQPNEARITPGFQLPTAHVIHTCAPVAQPQQVTASEAQLLQCYRNCLAVAATHQLQSIAFPCIGTRLRGFKHDRAACIALKAIIAHFETATAPQLVRLVCRSDFDYRAYQAQVSHPAIAPHLQPA